MAASPRQIKRVISLCSLRLRGEISILDKSDSVSKIESYGEMVSPYHSNRYLSQREISVGVLFGEGKTNLPFIFPWLPGSSSVSSSPYSSGYFANNMSNSPFLNATTVI